MNAGRPALSPPVRVAVTALALLAFGALAAAAWFLPWRWPTPFGVIAALASASYVPVAVTVALGLRVAPAVWRWQSWAALAFAGWLLWLVATSGVHVAVLYGSLGQGVAAGLGAAWLAAAALIVPLGIWGIATSRRLRRGTIALAGIAGLFLAGSLVASGVTARGAPLPVPDGLAAVLATAVRDLPEIQGAPASLHTVQPAVCPAAPGAPSATAILTYAARDRTVRTRCFQAPPAELPARMRAALALEAARGPVKLDVVTSVRSLGGPPLASPLSLRPAADGVCAGERCLAPWQLVAQDRFNSLVIPLIPDLRLGVSLPALRRALGVADDRRLVAIATESTVLDPDGGVEVLARERRRDVPLDAPALAAATAAAEAFVHAAQDPDGRFLYLLDPHTGRVSFRDFSVPRQAGTTLVVCELSKDAERLRVAAARSLDMLASLERRSGEASALVFPPNRPATTARVGHTALPLIAFLACRDVVGPVHDALIGRLARLLLALQRPDGSFRPTFDLAAGAPREGPHPLFADGQVVMALVMLEGIAAREESPALPAAAELREAVERAMSWVAGPYWDHAAHDLLFLEENWHCLAARAALPHHRHDGYERFCLDYATFKRRFVLDDESEVDPAFLGGFGFGNLIVPYSTPAAGLGETLAAAIAVARARGEDAGAQAGALRRVLAFLLRQQWDERTCYACTPTRRIAGAFSESLASPQLRIDYTQHAWAALGHGGRVLGLVP